MEAFDLDGAKMSVARTWFARDALKQVDSEALRYFFLPPTIASSSVSRTSHSKTPKLMDTSTRPRRRSTTGARRGLTRGPLHGEPSRFLAEFH
jgi:hypothetical protein